MPDLTGMPVAEARNLIAPNDWEIDVQGERSDEQPEVGDVMRTAPAAGVELAEGEPFLMVVSEGPLLPRAARIDRQAAQRGPDRARRRCGWGSRRSRQFDEVVQPGTVIAGRCRATQRSSAGSMVEPETVVQLVVSKGPAPRVVPNIIGLSVADATTQLSRCCS